MLAILDISNEGSEVMCCLLLTAVYYKREHNPSSNPHRVLNGLSNSVQ